MLVSFNGHKSAVTTLCFAIDGAKLASGAKDADVILWDLIAEVGLYKLRGHKDQITGLQFLDLGSSKEPSTGDIVSQGLDDSNPLSSSEGANSAFLMTTSKDSLIRLWDLSSQHCIETHVAQSNGECWSLSIAPAGSGCITSGNDGEIKVWWIDTERLGRFVSRVGESEGQSFLKERGTIYRQGKDRTMGTSWHARGNFIFAHGSDKSIELWRIRTDSEVQKALARKRKRKREKAQKDGGTNGMIDEHDEDTKVDDVLSAEVSDLIIPYVIIRSGSKIRSATWAGGNASKSVQILATTNNNQIELYNVDVKSQKPSSKSDAFPDYTRIFSVELPGHRTDVRSLALSSDDHMLASASNASLKIWNVRTETCIRTLECGFAICSAFLPGDKIVVIGTRAGALELFDIASSTLISTLEAHTGAIWTLDVHPNGTSLVTGSADKSVKFFSFEIFHDEIPGTKRTSPRFGLKQTRTLQLSDEILSVRFSPDARLLAVSLLDNTVRVYFNDTLKPFLNLYGHKLPVLSLSISYDSKLIATCSADKNIRIWGLDFGDCHKAFFAHSDSIMAVAFVPNNADGNGHHVFSASKDKTIKYWDADKFQHIQTLPSHHGEIWAMAISRSGDFLVSASHDKSIRIWRQTDEQLFLEEEREKELEDLYDAQLTSALDADLNNDPASDGVGQAPDNNNSNNGNLPLRSEVATASKQTPSTLKAGEKLAEALTIALPDHLAMTAYHTQRLQNPSLLLRPPDRPAQLLALSTISAPAYILRTLLSIPLPNLQDALLTLPFNLIPPLFTFLRIFLDNSVELPLVIRTMVFLLKIHWRQVRASERDMKGLLDGLRVAVRKGVEGEKGIMGRNLAGLRVWGRRVEESREVGMRIGEDEEVEGEIGGGREVRKRAFVDVG